MYVMRKPHLFYGVWQGAVSRRLGPRLQVAPRRGMVCHNQAARLVSLRRSNIYALTDIEGYEPWTS